MCCTLLGEISCSISLTYTYAFGESELASANVSCVCVWVSARVWHDTAHYYFAKRIDDDDDAGVEEERHSLGACSNEFRVSSETSSHDARIVVVVVFGISFWTL